MSPIRPIVRRVLSEALDALRTPRPEPGADTSTELDAGLVRFSHELRAGPTPEAATAARLVAGGIAPDDARRIAEVGLTAEGATDLLSVKLLHPEPDHYGPAVVALSLLMEARASGALSPAEVQARLDRLDGAVLVRSDGYLVPANGGRAIERRADLDPGRIYRLSGGVLRALDGDGTPVAELGLRHTASGDVLDGVEITARSVILRVGGTFDGLIHQPEETFEATVHDFGRLPQTIGRAIRTSPQRLEAFQQASPDDQRRMVGEALAHAYLMMSAAAAVPRAAGALGMTSGLGGLAASGSVLALRATASLRIETAVVAHAAVDIAFGGAALADALDLFDSPTPGNGRTTLRDPKGRTRVRDRIRRTLGDPKDSNLSLHDLEQMVADAKEIDEATLREVKAMVLDRLEKEISNLHDLPEGLRKVRVDALADFAERTGIDLRDAVRSLAPAPARTSLSAEAQRALRKLDQGEAEIQVSSRAVVEEILSQFPDYVETENFRFKEIKQLFDSKEATFHWDDVFGEDGRLLNHDATNPHAEVPHLQIHPRKAKIIRILFPTEAP